MTGLLQPEARSRGGRKDRITALDQQLLGFGKGCDGRGRFGSISLPCAENEAKAPRTGTKKGAPGGVTSLATKQRGWFVLFCGSWRLYIGAAQKRQALRLSQCPLWTCGCLALKGMRLLLRLAPRRLSWSQAECHLTWPGFMALLPVFIAGPNCFMQSNNPSRSCGKSATSLTPARPPLKGGGFPPAKPPHFSLPCGAPAWREEPNGGLSKEVPTARSLFAQHMGRASPALTWPRNVLLGDWHSAQTRFSCQGRHC